MGPSTTSQQTKHTQLMDDRLRGEWPQDAERSVKDLAALMGRVRLLSCTDLHATIDPQLPGNLTGVIPRGDEIVLTFVR